MKRFASIKDCSRFSALCDLPETFFKNFFFGKIRIFFRIFLFFFQRFPVEKDGFLAVSSWGRMVLEIYAYPFGNFCRCEIDEILMSFYTWFSVILLIWFSSEVRNLLRKCLRSTASPLCLNCFKQQ